jgi:formamidopyrimidine-DNA glycosylase
MPELPEVQTTVNILNKEVKGLKIIDIWTDYNSPYYFGKNSIKDKKYFSFFRKELLNKKIISVKRRAKNVLINVSGNTNQKQTDKTILVHMKMTGKLLYGNYAFDGKKWSPKDEGALKDPYNRFIHLVFSLSDKKHLVLSDTRKFAKVVVFDTDKIDVSEGLNKLGPEPLSEEFSFKKFKERLLKKPNGKIKTVLMDQEIIAGIGNIYSDEVLWYSMIHPLEKVQDIGEEKMKSLFKNIKKILKQSIKLGGDSMSDYRNPYGEKGGYQKIHKVYRRVGEKCLMKGCLGIIKRIKVGGRSSHFCDCHQILSTSAH